MFKLLASIILLIMTASLANAEVVKSVQISGNKRVSDETIKIYGGVATNKDFSETTKGSLFFNSRLNSISLFIN